MTSSVASLLLAFLSIGILTVWMGPHEACSRDPDVGPCALGGRFIYMLPLTIVAFIFFWTLILVVEHIGIIIRERKQRNT